MDEGIYIAASGANKQQRKLDIISNNLANLNNTGFKKDQVVFQSMMTPFKNDLSFENSRNALLPPATSNDSVVYVGISGFSTDHSQGTLQQTGNTFDLALEGEGYFSVQTPSGVRYTRRGDFRLDNQSRLVSQNGYPLLGDKGEFLTVEASNRAVDIDSNGTISVGVGLENLPLGKLKLVDFKDKSQLVKEGDGLFRMNDAKAQEIPAQASIRQTFIENSNVNSVAEMTGMMETLRAFEAYQKVIQSIDRIDNESVNTIGRIA